MYPSDLTKRFQNSLISWSNIAKLNAEQGVARSSFMATIETIVVSDKFLNWLLALTGLAFSLVIGNFKECLTVIDKPFLKWFLLILVISGCFGFMSKAMSYYVFIYREVIKQITNLMYPVLDNYFIEHSKIEEMAKPHSFIEVPEEDLDFEKILGYILEPYNCLERKFIEKGFRKGMKDHLLVYKKGVVFARWHSYFLLIEMLFIIASVSLLIIGLW